MDSKVSPRTVAALGSAQTLAWASSYYLPAMLAASMARTFQVSTPAVFAAFSASLVVSALLGPYAGAAIDHFGGRPVLIGTNLVFALGLAMLATASNVAMLWAGWLVIGVGMGSGLYEAAFAALVRLHGQDSRGAITGITLIAGFASTVGWPLSSWLETSFGWRDACLVWAALHLMVGIPLNALVPKTDRRTADAAVVADRGGASPAHERRAAWLLGYVFAVTWFIATAMAAHLPRLMQAAGATLAVAVFVGALVGPAQVVARLLEYGLLRRAHPLLSARIASLLHPAGALLLLAFGAPVAAAFAILHGAGNGILTIAMGTLPLAIFGADGYGRRQGLLMVPARVAQASAPWLYGIGLDRWGAQTLWLSASLGLTAFVALLLLPRVPGPAG
jgi:predicted MFS family arabinose efflux permease